MGGKAITQEEKDFIEQNYNSMANIILARTLHKSVQTVQDVVVELADAGKIQLKRPRSWGKKLVHPLLVIADRASDDGEGLGTVGTIIVDEALPAVPTVPDEPTPVPCAHHRLCGNAAILSIWPQFYVDGAHPFPGSGQEWQVCKWCLDAKLVRLYDELSIMGIEPQFIGNHVSARATASPPQEHAGSIIPIKQKENTQMENTAIAAQSEEDAQNDPPVLQERIRQLTHEYTVSLSDAHREIMILEELVKSKDNVIDGLQRRLEMHDLRRRHTDLLAEAQQVADRIEELAKEVDQGKPF